MLATVLHSPRDIRCEEVADPKILYPTDAIIQLSASCICGSDLWPYRGTQAIEAPMHMGHEYCGIVVEVGSEVRTIRTGQFVVGSFCISDNTCPHRVFEVFVPLNASVVTDYADLIPGVLEAHAALRERGVKIGSTTGYTRSIMERLLPVAAEQGLSTDNLVCAGGTPEGRPTPQMMYRCFLDLGVWPAASVVKVDDTEVGIKEGLAAGSWTVGVALSGNAAGLSRADLEALSEAERGEMRAQATSKLLRCGAHFVIDSVAGLLPVIDEIEGRLARGERP